MEYNNISKTINSYPDRVEEINAKIYSRVMPDTALKPNYDPRPIQTKYVQYNENRNKNTNLLPDLSNNINKSFNQYLDYYPEVIFNPGNSRGPIDCYFSNIEKENILRNQTQQLKKPNMLININKNENVLPLTKNNQYENFEQSKQSTQPLHPSLIIQNTFHNFTRNQIRNSAT
jgi:hypothetical protein